MAGSLPIGALSAYIASLRTAAERASTKAMVEATEIAYRDALLRIVSEFNHTPGRIRSGQLNNSIYRGFDPEEKVGFLASRLAYARIQELGGEVTPKNARHLWVKNYTGVESRFRRMTPKEFMTARAASPSYALIRSPHTNRLFAVYRSGRSGVAQTQLLFSLVDRVRLPPRPYLTPAVEAAARALPELLARYMAQEASP